MQVQVPVLPNSEPKTLNLDLSHPRITSQAICREAEGVQELLKVCAAAGARHSKKEGREEAFAPDNRTASVCQRKKHSWV
ncbi:hypothetical protein Y1Q_0001918 [Alligator mississippiensis]|uniref:Uncharacterized protein n=1 Tax=Alligator mississippiensis TaxID=8496 RepID=A0A151PGH8_ALLMI|nr:hypothetical protein Y1Q_0001918 [Alligator mississippiensis]